MKKALLFLPVLFLICASARATNYYLAANGNDGNSGTSTSSPWKTLSKLNSFFNSLKAGDNIYLNRGDVFYGSLTVTKSGSSGSPITISAYGSGANPVITGFTTVTSWTNLGSNIWESSSAVSSLSTCNIVVINGVNTPMGRYPNTGWLTYQSHSGTTSITSNQLSGSTNWTGAESVTRIIRWTLQRDKIKSQSGGTITFAGSGNAPTDGYGFFIQNDIRTLDVSNEWYYNPSTKKIRVYHQGTPTNVQMATIDELILTNGANYITFDHIDFKGANSNLFENRNGKYITAQNCSFLFAGQKAMLINGKVSYNEIMIIDNNVFSDNNDNAMNFSSYSANTWVKNNTINNTGMIPGAGSNDQNSYDAIDLVGQNSIVEYNKISNTGHIAIGMRQSDGMIARYNYISYFGMTKYDAGGIYSWNQDSNKVKSRIWDHNMVIYSKQTSDGIGTSTPSLFGIYLDGDSKNTSITNNTVAHCKNGVGIFILNTGSCTVSNNVSYDNGQQLGIIHAWDFGMRITNMTITNNVFFARTSDQTSLNFRDDDNTLFNKFGKADNNYYAKPLDGNSAIVSQVQYNPTNRTIVSWQALSGQDAHSKACPKSITDTNDLRFEYNATASSKTISLPYNYIDVTGASYNGSITLAPYSSAVLIKNGATSGATLLPAVNPGNTVNGLDYSYYEASSYSVIPDFSTLTPVKTGNSSNFDISSANRATAFSFDFSGYISVPTDGQYSFYTSSDDGSNLYIDNVPVVNNDGIHPSAEKSGIIGLKAGLHAISVGFFQQGDGSLLTVSYSGNGISKQAIPGSSLFRVSGNSTTNNNSNGLNYTYYEGNYSEVPDFPTISPVKQGISNNFDITLANRADQFAFNFTGFIKIPTSGKYTFYTTSDDGSKLYVDGIWLVNNDGVHAATEASGGVNLAAGMHSISVGFFEQTGGQVLSVSYQGPGISKQVIPSSVLFTNSSAGNTMALSNNNNIISQTNPDPAKTGIRAYPNPFMDFVNIDIAGDAGDYKLVLVDVSGRILWTKTGSKNAGTFTQSINTSSLQRGVYFLKVIQNDKSSVIKLMK